MAYLTAHTHSQTDVVGYRVRQTIRDSKSLVGKELVVLGNFEDPRRYLDALDLARANRRSLYRSATSDQGRRVLSESESDRRKLRELLAAFRGRPGDDAYLRGLDYACVDPVYRCGCTWGDDDYPPDVLAAVDREGYWYQPNGGGR